MADLAAVAETLEAGLRAAGRPAQPPADAGRIGPGDLVRMPEVDRAILERTLAAWRRGAIPIYPRRVPEDSAFAGIRVWSWQEELPTLERDGCPWEGAPLAVAHASSASSGEAKLVGRFPASVLAEWRRYRTGYPCQAGDAALLALPLCHSFGWGAFFGFAAAGCRTEQVAPHPMSLLHRLLAGEADLFVTVAPLLRLVLNSRGSRIRAAAPRAVIVGAGPVPLDLDRQCRERLGVGISRNYGSTETGATLGGPPRDDEAIGPPLDGVAIVSPVAGETGPLVLRIAEREAPYRTGDVATQHADGALEIVGRETSLVKLNGRSVFLDAVARSAASLPGVEDAAAFARERERTPELIDLYLLFSGAAAADAVRTGLLDEFPELRASLRVRALRALPRDGAGKLPRAVLEQCLGDRGAGA